MADIKFEIKQTVGVISESATWVCCIAISISFYRGKFNN